MQKILIYNSGGGIGDSIQIIPLILSLNHYFKKSQIYYIGAHENHYKGKLKEYNVKIKDLELDLKYFGFRWWHLLVVKKKILKLKIHRFDLVIDLQSKIRNTLILKKISCVNFYSSTYNYHFCSNSRNFSNNKDLVEETIDNLNIMLDTKIEKINYSLENISENIFKEAKRLLPNNNYIGFSITQGNRYRQKSWPIQNFIELAKKIRAKNKVPVFFVEKSYDSLITKIKSEVPNALFPEHKSIIPSPALVTALSTRLDKAISIDNGVMHMIALANIKMIVLFGPTNAKKFAPKMKNVRVLDSKNIYKNDDISKIIVSDVFKYI